MACEICGSPAAARCPLCGRAVCERHMDRSGMCAVCKEALCEICGERLSVARCVSCGRLGCDSCLTQIDNVRRICAECLKGQRSPDAAELRRLSEAVISLKRRYTFKSSWRERGGREKQ